MNRFLSQKFRFYSFVCIALLLFVHGYNLKIAYLSPASLVNEDLTFTTFIEYLFANGLLRFRIPILFLISAYIFAMHDQRPYGERIKKRFISLMIPYFIWSAVGLAITFLLQQFPATARIVHESQLDQLGDNRPYKIIGWVGVLFRWIVAPVSFQLWFIRSLFVYNLLYPVFKWAVLKYPVITFCILFLFWVSMSSVILIEGQGMFFFALGIWLNKTNYQIINRPDWYSSSICWLFFVGISVIRTFMAFEFETNTPLTIGLLTVLYIISVGTGVLAIWYSADSMIKWFMERRWFVWASSFSFIIYGLHIPILAYLTQFIYLHWNFIPDYRLLTYIIAPVFVLVFCIGTGALFRVWFPKIYRIATGGRGF